MMDNKYQNTNQINNIKYDLDFGVVLEKSFQNYKKIVGIAGLGLLLSSVFIAIIFGGIFGSIYGFANFTETMTGFSTNITMSTQIIIVIFGALFAGVFSPINAGFLQMAANANNNTDFGLSTLFSFFSSSDFKNLFISATLLSLLGGLINFGFEYAGVKYVGTIVSLIISFFTILTIPIIIFYKLDAVTAITSSLKLVLQSPIIIFGLAFVAFIFACLGIFGLCLGVFFTIPFWYSMNFIIYNEIVPAETVSFLDEIGSKQE